MSRTEEEQPDLIIYHTDCYHPSKNNFGYLPKIWFSNKEYLTETELIDCFEHGVDFVRPENCNDHLIKAKVRGTINAQELKEDFVKKKLLFGDKGSDIKSKEIEFIERIYDYLSDNCLTKEFSIEKMSKDLAMSRTNFFSKVKSITGASPSKLVMNYRLENAVVLIQQNNGNITEIAYKVGFTSTAYFTKCFKEKYGISPSQMSKAIPKTPLDQSAVTTPQFNEEQSLAIDEK